MQPIATSIRSDLAGWWCKRHPITHFLWRVCSYYTAFEPLVQWYNIFPSPFSGFRVQQMHNSCALFFLSSKISWMTWSKWICIWLMQDSWMHWRVISWTKKIWLFLIHIWWVFDLFYFIAHVLFSQLERGRLKLKPAIWCSCGFQPNLSGVWMYQRAMSVRLDIDPSPDFINNLLSINFQCMEVSQNKS